MQGIIGKKINYTTSIRRNLDSLPAGASRTLVYDAVGIAFTDQDEALRTFGYNNIVYLNTLMGTGNDNNNDRLFTRLSESGNIGSSYSLDKATQVSLNGTGITVELDEDEIVYTLMIHNSTGYTLPATGGTGTNLFYLIGSTLITGAGLVLVKRRRRLIR